MRIGIISGGFDPIHSGHIEYISKAAGLCDKLIVGVNSDEWLTRKKGRSFMPHLERKAIVESLTWVDEVLPFNDDDNTAINLIEEVKRLYPNHSITFMNGGDRTAENIPEMVFDDVSFMFGVGGNDKKNSSSWILEEWKKPRTERPWGWYRVLDEGEGWAVKELTILPGKSLSDQKHTHRSEHWHVVQGIVNLETEYNGDKQEHVVRAKESFDIGKQVWHRAYNNNTTPAKIIETWFGEILTEEDIERR